MNGSDNWTHLLYELLHSVAESENANLQLVLAAIFDLQL